MTKWRSGVGYIVPALLYSLYDNLYYVILGIAEPVTWHALSNIKILITGLFVQVKRTRCGARQSPSLLSFFFFFVFNFRRSFCIALWVASSGVRWACLAWAAF